MTTLTLTDIATAELVRATKMYGPTDLRVVSLRRSYAVLVATLERSNQAGER